MIELLQWLFKLYWVKAVLTMLLLYGLTRIGFTIGGALWPHIWATAYAVLGYIALWSLWCGDPVPYIWPVVIASIVIQCLQYILYIRSK